MENTDWKTDKLGEFSATVPAVEISASEYQLYLEQWQSIVHPSALKIVSSQVSIAALADGEILKAEIVSESMTDGFNPVKECLSSLLPMERIFLLRQTVDLADVMRQNDLLHPQWKMENLYIHSSGHCQWLPASPREWTQQQTENWFEGVRTFALALFDLKVPQKEYEWRELENAGKLPWEWSVFLRSGDVFDEKHFSHSFNFTDTFKFVFFQSWIYSAALQLAMKDNTISSSDFDLLQKLRAFLGFHENQAEVLDMLSQKPDTSWEDLVAVLKGEFKIEPTRADTSESKHGPSENDTSDIDFHPDRACNIPEEHIGREDIIYHAYSRLITDDIQSFAVVGFKKEGKTSLINYIMEPAVQKEYLGTNADNYYFLYINFKKGMVIGPEEFFKEFYEKASQLMNIDGLHNLWDDLPRITDYLEKNDRKLVVVFDNFHLIINNPNFPVVFYEALRSWFSTHREVGCIVSSPLQLLYIKMPGQLVGSPFFNIFNSYSVYPLTTADATQLIETRLPPGLRAQNKAVATLIDNFGCSPYPLHIAGKVWADHFKKREDISFEAMTEEIYQACLPYYEKIYVELNNKQLINIKNVLNPKRKTNLPIDNTLIDRGWIKKSGQDVQIASKQLDRFFRKKLEIKVSSNLFSKLTSIFQRR